jgi:hypothetical protein
MRSPLVIVVAVTLAAVLSLSAQAVPPPVPPSPIPRVDTPADADLAGVYACEGTRPDGVEYSGTVEIVRNEGTYQLLWTLPPHEQYIGIGIRNGDVLAVSYFGGMPGLVVYRLEQGDKGPRLVGQWTVVDADGQVFPETLTRVAAGDAPAFAPSHPRPRSRPGRSVPSRGTRPI